MSRMILILVFVAIVGFTSASPDQCIGKCPAHNPNNDVWHLPHEDCEKYCSCVYGRPVEMPCPPGLHYSQEARGCAFPEQANCVRSSEDI